MITQAVHNQQLEFIVQKFKRFALMILLDYCEIYMKDYGLNFIKKNLDLFFKCRMHVFKIICYIFIILVKNYFVYQITNT